HYVHAHPPVIHHVQSHPPVILSGARASRSEALSQSKDPVSACIYNRLVREFSAHSIQRASNVSHRFAFVFAALLLLASLASAQTLTGTVKNATTGKPASGDDVILLKLGQGMEEAGRTQADSNGNFTFKLDDAQAPHLIRAVHQEVTYHRMAPPGTTSVEVDVYDVSKKVEGIEVVADVMWIQTEKGQLEIIR